MVDTTIVLGDLTTRLRYPQVLTFFRRIDVVNIESVPKDGPVIFAGNHPNALMDGWLLTAKCGRWPLRIIQTVRRWYKTKRVDLVEKIRDRVDRTTDKDTQRIFTQKDFGHNE